MAKFVNGKRYDTDFFPIDDAGNRIGDKDKAASEEWTNENEPWRNTPGWHGQPLTAAQAAGRKAADPKLWAEREAWRAANPTTANGAPIKSTTPPATGGTRTGAWNMPAGATSQSTSGQSLAALATPVAPAVVPPRTSAQDWYGQVTDPNVVAGFNIHTGERVPGTPMAQSIEEMVALGWDPQTAQRLWSTWRNS